MNSLLISALLGALLVILPISAEAKTYENDLYAFEYPNGCKLEKKENRFSTTNAILDCKGDAGIQFESSAGLSDSISISSDDTLVESMENVFDSLYENVDIVETGTDKYIINNLTAPYILGTYDQEFSNAFGFSSTEPYVLMGMIIKLNSDDVILVQYRNNEDDFDKDLPMAEKIFKSVEGKGNVTTGTESKSEIESKYEYDDRLTPEENAEIAEYCNNPTNQIAKDICNFIS